MSLRARIGLLTALTVGLALLLASAGTYLAVSHRLRHQIDEALSAQGTLARKAATNPQIVDRFRPGGNTRVPSPPASLGAPTAIQVLDERGVPRPSLSDAVPIPVTARDRAVVRGGGAFFSTRQVGAATLRVYTFAVRPGTVIQIARSLNPTEELLRGLRRFLAALVAAAAVGGGLLGRAFAGRALRPVADLTSAVEQVELTDDLTPRIRDLGTRRRDEVGRLTERFNAMLTRLDISTAALRTSLTAQRQLVADASHELRTPITSLRTNAEVLRADLDLPAEQRAAILDDMTARAEELGDLIGDLIELARSSDVDPELVVDDLRLDHLVEAVVSRAERHAIGAALTFHGEAVIVRGDRERIARAVSNLIDNAVKYAGTSGPVEVSVRAPGIVEVRDHGPGIPPEELPRVFDRFWRGADVRDVHGSGLGLSIVRQVAEDHHGEATIENAPDGGVLAQLRL